MRAWQPPPGITGDGSLIRTSLPMARGRDEDCPTALAVKARPGLKPDPASPRKRTPIETFGLGRMMDLLDRIEGGEPLDSAIDDLRQTRGALGRKNPAIVHPGLLEWTAEALPRYLRARAADQEARLRCGNPPLLPVRDVWIAQRKLHAPDTRGASVYEQSAWARRYASADGKVRELWLLGVNDAKADRPLSELAAAAHVAAFGIACDPRAAFRKPYRPRGGPQASPDHRVERVRIVSYGCSQGTAIPLLEWDLDRVNRNYTEHAKPVLGALADSTARNPGSSCVDCKVLPHCDAPYSTSQLFGLHLPTQTRPRRSVSASDLREHAKCPARFHLTRQLWLADSSEESSAIRLGRSVDAWLNMRHQRPATGGCLNTSGPENPEDWSVDGHRVTGESARIGAKMIAQHAAVCPMGIATTNVPIRVQERVTCYEPDLDVVAVALPDLLYQEDGGWIWRETKTSSHPRWEGRSLLEQVPQVALAVLMVASGALGGRVDKSRVELEVLGPDDVTLEELDPGHAPTLDEARRVLRDDFTAWYLDTEYPARPGKSCADCAALSWCLPGKTAQPSPAGAPSQETL